MPEDAVAAGAVGAAPTHADIVARYGPWSAMSIHLGGDRFTRSPAPDWRLRRIVQVASDLLGRPLEGARVLDLACLEGHYAIELALHGAEAIGTEVRDANLEKARWAAQQLGLKNVVFAKEDVRDLSRQRLGGFDLVICSGILYHLDEPAVFEFAQRVADVTDRMAIVDTQIALHPRVAVPFNGIPYHGLWYSEHPEGANAQERERDLWASVDNTRSLWLTEPSLMNLLRAVGFTSVLRIETPEMDGGPPDRRAYVAIRGKRARILSSPATEALREPLRPEVITTLPNPIQTPQGLLFRTAKRLLPEWLKAWVKPFLRALRVLPPDSTPEFMRRQGGCPR